MTSSKLRVFVSSKMEELSEERRAVKAALDVLRIEGWIFEEDGGARPESIQQTYLHEVEQADLYIGLFWKGYGNYTIEEYEHAIKKRKDCLIYEKRFDIENKRDPQLEEFLKRLGKVETGHTIRWFNTAEELRKHVQEDVARWQTQVIRRKVSGAPNVYQNPSPPDDNARQELAILASKVEHFWIKGVLENSLHDQVLIELRKEKITGAVEHPWETVLELPDDVNSSIPTDKPIQEVFEDVGRRLLILGAPGSGKTTTLLELARELLSQNENDANCALPAVFNLSSWADRAQPLIDWLVDELKSKYQIPTKTGRTWLEEHRLIPLLDGLDEVRSDKQAECVDAINDFVQEYPSGVVVCSRVQEYSALQVQLKLNGAICLQPLSIEQTDEYLKKAGPDLAALREALKEDQTLQEIVRTPLMLSIVSLTYQNQPVEALSSASSETIGSRRTQVFDLYIDRMLRRKGKQKDPYTNDQIKLWLSRLAQRMKVHSQSIFVVEQLQPAWLRGQTLLYLFISRLLAGLLLGTAIGTSIGAYVYIRYADIESAAQMFLYLSLSGLILSLVTCVAEVVRTFLGNRFSFIALAMDGRDITINVGIHVFTWFVLLSILRIAMDRDALRSPLREFFPILVLSLVAGIFHWMIFGTRKNQRYWWTDIQTLETLSWSWASAIKSGAQWAIITLIIMFPLIFITLQSRAQALDDYIQSRSQAEVAELESQLAANEGASINEPDEQRRTELQTERDRLLSEIKRRKDIIYVPVQSLKELVVEAFLTAGVLSLVIGLAGISFGGIRGGVSKQKTIPNQGIRLSIRNAAFKGITVGLIAAVLGGAALGYLDYQRFNGFYEAMFSGFAQGVVVGLVVGLLVGFRSGWFDVIKHYSLRFVLSYKGYTPRNVVGVLNYASKLILMQRVGGGYIFIHRLLLEHFAAMDEAGQNV